MVHSESPKPFAAYDVDGTVFKSSLAEKLVDGGIAHNLFSADAFNDVYANRKRWQENNNEGTYQAYIKRLVGALVTQISGVEVERFNLVVQNIVDQHQVRRFKFPRMLMRALAPTHANIAISGSPRLAVEPFVADLPLSAVYGSEFVIRDGVFTGEAKSVGDKAAILHDLTSQGEVTQPGSVALGDTVGDISALEYAAHPVMFNPSRTLASYGQEFSWDQVLEVKDRILVMRLDLELGKYVAADLENFLDNLQASGQ